MPAPMTNDRATSAALLARLDRLPATRHVWTMVVLLSLGGMFEFYDLFMTGYVVPGLVRAGMLAGLSVGMFSGPALFVASTFGGLFIGTFVFGFVADAYGRCRSAASVRGRATWNWSRSRTKGVATVHSGGFRHG